jgi:uncharacterized protein (TIGR02001 family)
MNKQLLAMLVLLTAVSGTAQAVDVSGNIGFNSDYIFRGVKLSSSAANGGVDLTEGNWNVGTWLSDVNTENLEGVEIDVYGGWSGQTDDWTYGVGGTGYFFTDNFDADFYELNLSGGYQLFTLDIAIGKWDVRPNSQDYTFVSGTFEKAGFYGIVGLYFQDFDGGYLQFGYGNTLAVKDVELFDWTISLISSFDIEADECGGSIPCPLADDTSLVLSLTRSFGIYPK